MTSIATLPGIAFEAVPSAVDESLPRMDVAGFVGFAACGPVDVPVLVEDALAFRDVFGPDLELARTEQGAPVLGHLGRAVEAFFANGGRRAWVVRAARTWPSAGPGDAGRAATNRFVVPGLVVPGAPDGVAGWRVSTMAARSAGAWSDGLGVGAALEVTATLAVEVRPGEVVVDHATDLVVGDLLRVVLDADTALAAEVVAIRPDPDGRCAVLDTNTARLEVRRAPEPGATAHRLGPDEPVLLAFFSADAVAGDDLVLVADTDEVSEGDVVATELDGALTLVVLGEERPHGADPGSRRFAVRGSVGVEPLGTVWPEPATARAVVEVLRARVTIRDDDEVIAELGGLGLGAGHPRSAMALPDDDRIYTALQAPGDADEAAGGTVRSALDPFEREVLSPRFPVAGPGRGSRVIPLGLPTDPTAVVFGGRVTPPGDDPPPVRNGLAVFDASLFVDPALAALGVDTVLGAAWDLAHVGRPPRRLRGMHALTSLDEVTLVAVPDAVHTGWTEVTVVAPPPLVAPRLAVDDVDEVGLRLHWSAVPTATSYQLEVDLAASFPDPVRHVIAGRTATASARAECPTAHYLRARATRGDEIGPWSAVVVLLAPAGAFVPCTLPGLAAGAEEQPGSPAPDTVAWRANPPGVAAPWGTLRAVHTAMLRWCAARGDMLAVLALPASFRAEQAVRHVAVVRGDAPAFDAGGRERAGSALGGGVPALTQDEAFVLGYGAVYHPWLVGGRPGPDLRATPPDGAVVGTYAARSIARGAWLSPARLRFERTLAVTPVIEAPGLAAMVAAGVNPVVEAPSGFLALTSSSMTDVVAVRPVNVRRLIGLLRRLAVREGARIVFEPHDRELQRMVRLRFERFLTELYLRGAFVGDSPQQAFEVSTGDAVNPPQAVDTGRFVVEVRIAPSRPLELITVRLVLAGTDQTRGAA